jgi:hypothetical protein
MSLQFEKLGSQFADFVSDPTSEDSVAWAEANHLKVSHTPSIHGVTYHIVRYDRTKFGSEEGQVPMPDDIRMLRSVIIATGRIVSVCLPKCVSSDTIDDSHELMSNTIMEEGPMVNVFYMPNDDRIQDEEDKEQFGWQIATRSVIGARNSYYDDEDGKKVTFRDMFLEAMPNDLFTTLDRRLCYSFVVRHPKNRDVYYESHPHLVLVASFQPSTDFMRWDYLQTPLDHSYGNQLVSLSRVNDNDSQSLNDVLGSSRVYRDANGNLIRTKAISEDYPNLRKLRGTQSKLLFHYLTLRKQRGAVGQYLARYDYHGVAFEAYRQQIHAYTNQLWQSYVQCYVRREKPLGQYDGRFKQHMYNIHAKFKQQRQTDAHCKTRMSDVIQYVNSLAPAQLMYVLNWDRHANRHTRRSDSGDMEQ